MTGFDLSTIQNCYIGGTAASAIYYGSTKIWPTAYDYSRDYLTFVAKTNGIFGFTMYNSSNAISYSTDNGNTWTQFDSNISVNSGDKVLWKGTMTPEIAWGVGRFSSTAEFDVEGNSMSLLYGDNFIGQNDLTGKNYAFTGLFYGNTNLISAENMSLPATTLSQECYANMFTDCTSLVTAPELPATTLVQGCYASMFYDCTSLVTAPELPATTLVQGCYVTMFLGCSSLNYIKCLAIDISALACTTDWVRNVAASGNFYKNPNATDWGNGQSGIPSGWNVYNASM